MTTIKDLENMMKTPGFKKGVRINKIVTKKLTQTYGKVLTNVEIAKVVKEIPDWNPISIKDAVQIGNRIIVTKYGDVIFARIKRGYK
jgi:hypothetical protein